MIFVWAALFIAGLGVSGLASSKALSAAESLGQRAGLSPFVIGLTIVAIGTDLPEIANSISAAAAGRGDISVGDSTGSAATQITFVLGALCILRPIKTNRALVVSAGGATVAALLVGAWMMADGQISRLDGALLVLGWSVSTFLVGRVAKQERTSQPSLFTRGVTRDLIQTLWSMGAVAGGAAVAIVAFGEITDSLGVPDYATSFFVLSVGTSLPELFIGGRALRQGSNALVLGDILGSSLVDATLALGIGPLLFSIDVSHDAATGTLLVAAVVAAAVALLLSRTEHGRLSAVVLFGLYLALFPLLIA